MYLQQFYVCESVLSAKSGLRLLTRSSKVCIVEDLLDKYAVCMYAFCMYDKWISS